MPRKRKPKKNLGWAWKSLEKDQYKAKTKHVKKKVVTAEGFYQSREWREVRYAIFRKYEAACMICGRTFKDHGVAMHCDHIKPRSKFPELALNIDNIQILCEDCNLGKSNIDKTDWRP